VAAFQGQPPPPALDGPPPDRESAQTVEKGHGRIETRRITVSREVVPALDWPGVAQVCRIERTREVKGTISHETVYAITSLDRDHASPAALLALARDHWGIENRLHWRRDVLLSEDASRVRSGTVPQAMAMLRNTMLGIANLFGAPLPAVRMACAEDRCATIATVKNGFL
jgi:predicted transposase YbfD/YdcC